jgi:hypothetical protein
MMKRDVRLFALVPAAAFALALGAAAFSAGFARAAGPNVIELTQVPCQFVESENGVDHGFESMAKADCEAINGETGAERLAASKTIELEPGKYVFRVTNKNVPYELGFYLRGAGFKRLTLPKVSGGGLHVGATKDYVIELVEGEYLYSCPLNPTPDYRLVVKG